jgi:YD repeat-containing protein
MVTAGNASNPDDHVKWDVREQFYDLWGRLTTSTVYPAWPDRNNKVQTSYTYDYVGNVITITDPKNAVTRFQYDKLNRLVKVIDPLNQNTDYTYTALGNLREIKQYDGGQTFTTTKVYDELGRLKQTIDPSNQSDLLTYNAAGDLVQKRDLKQQTFGYSYDQLHRLKTATLGTASFNTRQETLIQNLILNYISSLVA